MENEKGTGRMDIFQTMNNIERTNLHNQKPLVSTYRIQC